MTFLNEIYGELDKVDKSVVVPIHYEGSDDEDIKMVPENNNSNSDYSVVSDSKCDNVEEREKENIFGQEFNDKLKLPLRPL